jgi:DNA-directed RNA polymerase specialized sigma24 family protein
MKSANGEPPDRDGPVVECSNLLAAYLEASDEGQAEGFVASLIDEFASPTIRRLVRVKLGFRGNRSITGYTAQEAEELCSEAIFQVLKWLKELKSSHEPREVRSFLGLVAVIAYRACSGYMRQVDPDRASLVKKVRYHLTSNPDFDIWQNDDKEWICGFANWRVDPETGSAPGNVERNRPVSSNSADPAEALASFRQAVSPQTEAGIKGVPDLLAAIFDWARAPMPLDELIDIAARWWRTREPLPATATHSGAQSRPPEYIPDPGADISVQLEGRQHLKLAWDEIVKLPDRQRLALLLNLRDPAGEGAIALFPFLGIVSFEEIAAALSMSPEDLIDLWDSLPLSDEQIAARLGATRQNVINLRRSARERLQRRLRVLGAGS